MNIAVFMPNWIGDAVMATPALRALRGHFPDARLIGVLKPYVAGVLEGSPWLDEHVYLGSPGILASLRPGAATQLRRQGIDLAVLFPNSFRSALIAWLGKCRRRVGYARYCRGPLLTDRLQPIRDENGSLMPSPLIDAYNHLVEYLGCPRPGYRMELFTTPRDEEEAGKIWQECRFADCPEVICLNPGAAFGVAKCWPIEYFVILARELADRRGSGVLVLCGPKERDLARQIAGMARRPTVFSLADVPQSLGLTKACIRRADLLVTTDSGPRHFAVAFDRPVVTLFGPTHIEWTETYHAKAIHLQKKVPCGPCQMRVCPIDHRCMKNLKPDEVLGAALELLRRYPGRTHAA